MSMSHECALEGNLLNIKAGKVFNRLFNTYCDISLPSSLNCSSAVHIGKTYLIGGGDPPYSSCFKINTVDFKVTQIPSLKIGRYKNNVISHQGELYTIGGINEDYLDSVEKLVNDKWVVSSTLNHSRADCSSCSVGPSIYIFGGFSLSDTIEKYNGSTWQVLKISLPVQLRHIGSFYHENNLYLVGGNLMMFRTNACNRNVYKLNLEREEVEEVKSLPVADCFEFPRKVSENRIELVGQRFKFSLNLEDFEWNCEEILMVCRTCFTKCGEPGENCKFSKKINFIKIFMRLRNSSRII